MVIRNKLAFHTPGVSLKFFVSEIRIVSWQIKIRQLSIAVISGLRQSELHWKKEQTERCFANETPTPRILVKVVFVA